MHELALARSLVELVCREAERQGFKRALEIRLKLGEYSGVVPAYILDLFPYAAQGTAAEGARLLFETLPGRFRCPDCGYEGEVERKKACCPRCGGTALKMSSGREFYVDSLKVE
jgi:hydrogenase nickel incorporation protein HypA/HybF